MIQIQLFIMKELMIQVTCLLSTPLSNNCLFNKHSIIFLWIYSRLSLVKLDHCVICCYCVCVFVRSVAQSTLLRPHGLQSSRVLCPWDFPSKNTGVGCHFLLQGIFPTQGSNLHLLHCRQILYYQTSPFVDITLNSIN